MTLTLELPPDVEARLKTNAALHGKDVGDYLLTLAENDPPIDLIEFKDMADFEASVAGVREGLADLEAGRTISFDEMFAKLEAELDERSKRQKLSNGTENSPKAAT